MFKTRLLLAVLAAIACGSLSSIAGARFYRLSERERKIYAGLRGIDSAAADRYLILESSSERAAMFDSLFQERPAEKAVFEQRIDEAYREFGRFSPMLDDRIPVYVRYGPPPGRRRIDPTKITGVTARIAVKPSEIWRYPSEGLEFDFIRLGHAFKIIARSEFGGQLSIPFLRESNSNLPAPESSLSTLAFDASFGRFRQTKNLTRLELYIQLYLADTTGCELYREIQIFDPNNQLLQRKTALLQPVNAGAGNFTDEVNLWLPPSEYRIVIILSDGKRLISGRREFNINLIEYASDTKEISDLVPAQLIDDGFTAEKFQKPLVKVNQPVHQPFYFYHEVYNLQTQNGMHNLRTTYQIYNLKINRGQAMEEEVVDMLFQEIFGEGDVAFLATKYHPMDLLPGRYLIVVRDKDLYSGKERSALGEFELVEKK